MKFLKQIIISIINSLGKKSNSYDPSILIRYLSENVDNLRIATKTIRHFEDRNKSFTKVNLPETIKGFEDLTFLFHSDSQANFGIILQNLENAAYLYKLVKGLTSPNIIEIGRYKGGTTFLMASASDEKATITSIDMFVGSNDVGLSSKVDRELIDALSKYGLDGKVKLLVADSTTFECGYESIDLILIDGDHSYKGVKTDFLNFYPCIKKMGAYSF